MPKILPPVSAIPSIVVSTMIAIAIIKFVKPMLPESVSKFI